MTKMKRAHVEGKYKVIFYTDKNGVKPTKEWLRSLLRSTNPIEKSLAGKINNCIDNLVLLGFGLREPHSKKLHNGIWELRPEGYRVLYAYLIGVHFIILHHAKKGKKREQDAAAIQAARNLAEYKSREGIK